MARNISAGASARTPSPYGSRPAALNLAAALAALALAGPVSAAPAAAEAVPAAPAAAERVLAAPAAAEPVLVAFGDSLTQGYGVAEENGFVPTLQAWLRANGAPGVRVINAGVSGDTSAGGLARIDWTLTPEVDAVIVELGANDLLRGFDPAETRANLDGVLDAIAARDLPALLVGVPGVGNFGPDYRAAFDAVFVDLAAEHGVLLFPNFFAGIGDLGDLDRARPLMQPDMIHPNAEGVAAVVAAIGPSVLQLIAAIPDQP